MSKRWNRATFQKPQLVGIASEPGFKAFPWEIRTPAQPACDRLEEPLEDKSRASLSADSIEQDDFAARLQHPRKFIQRYFRVRDRVHHALRSHDIKGSIRKEQLLGVHYRQAFHLSKVPRANSLASFAQH